MAVPLSFVCLDCWYLIIPTEYFPSEEDLVWNVRCDNCGSEFDDCAEIDSTDLLDHQEERYGRR